MSGENASPQYRSVSSEGSFAALRMTILSGSGGCESRQEQIPHDRAVRNDKRVFQLEYSQKVICMKTITLKADEHLIEQAHRTARSHRTTLNAAFREWLQEYVSGSSSAEEVDALMKRLRHVKAGAAFTRDEMNTR